MVAEREKNEKKAEKTLGTRLAACLLALLTVCGAAALPGCAKTEADTEPAVSETDVVSEADVPEEEPKKIVHPSMRFDNSYILPEDLETGEGNVIGGPTGVCRIGDWIYYTAPTKNDWNDRCWMRLSVDGHVRESLQKVVGMCPSAYPRVIVRNDKMYVAVRGAERDAIQIYDPSDDSVQTIDAGGYGDELSPVVMDMCADDEFLYYSVMRWDTRWNSGMEPTYICKMPLDGGKPQKLCEIDEEKQSYHQTGSFGVHDGKLYMTVDDKVERVTWLMEADAGSGEMKPLYTLPRMENGHLPGISLNGDRLCVSGRTEMTIGSIDGSEKELVLPGSMNANTPLMLGSKVVYANNPDNMHSACNRICCYDIDTGKTTVLWKGDTCTLCGADGNWVYFSHGVVSIDDIRLSRVRLDGTGLMEMP